MYRRTGFLQRISVDPQYRVPKRPVPGDLVQPMRRSDEGPADVAATRSDPRLYCWNSDVMSLQDFLVRHLCA